MQCCELHLEAKVGELSLERNHWVARVWNSNVGEEWDGSWDGIGAQETKDTELSQSTVVDFSNQTLLLGLCGHVLVEASRVVKIEDRVDSITERLERWVLSRLTSLGVMGHGSSATTLVPKLEHRNDGKDLPLGANRDGIPLSLRGQVSRWVCGTGKSLWPWEDKVRLNTVSNESKHSNTAVLDLGLTEPANGGFVTLGPEVLFSKIEWVIKLKLWVQLASKSLKVSLGLRQSSFGSTTSLGWGESGGTSNGGKAESELHYYL
mmetsp:Transcript_3805/g.6345  ORF Transcript_3805/g.6345 Transcript_3805/m.6345 type:complete len:263 (-) Transcript_3805:46-834(-)